MQRDINEKEIEIKLTIIKYLIILPLEENVNLKKDISSSLLLI